MSGPQWRDQRTRIVDALADRRNDALDRFDDARYAIDDRFPHAKRVMGWTGAVLTILVAVVVLGPVVRSSLSGPTSGTGAAQLPIGAAPSPTSLPSGQTDGPELSSTTSSSAPATTVAAERVETIELVPPLRDVIVVVDGVELVSDASGSISVPMALRSGSFSFVGVREQPPLRQVAFARWADGSSDDVRSLADVAGPIAELGIIERRRVTITTSVETPSGTEVRLDSQTGPISLTVGTSTWIDAEWATTADGTLVAEELRYTAEELVLDGTIRPVPPQVFTPSPEAIWVVDVDAVADPAPAPPPSQP